MPANPKDILDSINGVLTSSAAILAIITPWAIKVWRWLTTKEHNERVEGALDILERVVRMHVIAVEQTEGRGATRDETGKLTDEAAQKLREHAMQGIRQDYGDSWATTAARLGFSLQQLEAHVAKLIEAAVFTVKASAPPSTKLPPFGGMTDAEKSAAKQP